MVVNPVEIEQTFIFRAKWTSRIYVTRKSSRMGHFGHSFHYSKQYKHYINEALNVENCSLRIQATGQK